MVEKIRHFTYLEQFHYSNEFYPHEILWKEEIPYTNLLDRWALSFEKNASERKDLVLVVNIPFCETRCFYCTHNVSISNEKKYDEYLDVLEKEAWIHTKTFGKISINSLYIGWWTPTILSAKQLKRLYEILSNSYDLSSLKRNMIEFSPHTFSEEKVQIIKENRVNRVTFWIQDIDEEIMKKNNRFQSRKNIEDLVNSLKKNHISYINVDVMAWLAHQTLESFKNTVSFAKNLDVSNICLNVFKPTHKVSYSSNWLDLFSEKYLYERGEMIEFFRENYSSEKKNTTKNTDGDLYSFDDTNTSFLLLGYGTNGRIFWNLCYKWKSLEDYFSAIRWENNNGLVWFSLSIEHEITKYILLNLNENGVSPEYLRKLFWETDFIRDIEEKFNLLKKKSLIHSFIKEWMTYYKFSSNSKLSYAIFSKFFYQKDVINTFGKLAFQHKLKEWEDIDQYFKFYF